MNGLRKPSPESEGKRNWRPRGLRCFITLALVTASGGAIAACGNQSGSGQSRSAGAVCSLWSSDAVPLHSKYASDAAGFGINSFLDAISAPNDIAVLMDKMAAVAPTTIEPDFQAIGSALHQEASSQGLALTNPLGALASGLVNGLAVSGSEQRADQFLESNCSGLPGISSSASGGGSVAPRTSTTSTTSPQTGFVGSTSLSDEQGYQFGISYTSSLGTPSIDVQYDPPGQASILEPVAGSVTVTNATDGRIAPSDSFTFEILGLFSSSRPICQANTRGTGPTAGGIVQVSQPTTGSYCVIDFGESQAIDTTGLASNAASTASFDGVSTVADSGGDYPQQDAVIYLNDQTQAAGVIQDLGNGPDLWAFGQLNGTSGCVVDVGGGFFVKDVVLMNAAPPNGNPGPVSCQPQQ